MDYDYDSLGDWIVPLLMVVIFFYLSGEVFV
jgi:hypothetical protein